MIGCHYQDRPGRASLCLKEHYAWIAGGELGPEPELRMCEAKIEKKCEQRAWDHKTSLEVARSRSAFIGRCIRCGKRHATLFDSKRCLISNQIKMSLEQNGGWRDEGCCEHLPHENMPAALKAWGWKEVRRRVLARDAFVCQECKKPLSEIPSWFTEVHHIIPRERGGSDHPSNLKTLCLICHRAHTNELLAQLWLEAIVDASIIEARRRQLDLDQFVIKE
jgi:5-methylcytosine-specific restriction protein A